MSTRHQALAWMANKHRRSTGALYSSKFYVPEESWTGADAWWIQIPVKSLKRAGSFDLLCQASPGSTEFRHLRVPSEFFRTNLARLSVVGDATVSLFLSAERRSLFVDQRGDGKVAFGRFEQ